MRHSFPGLVVLALAANACAGGRAGGSAHDASKPTLVLAQPTGASAGKEDESTPCPGSEHARPIAPKLPNGYEEMTVADVAPAAGGGSVVLVDSERKLGIPILVGGSEATSIRVRANNEKYTRPLTHDLLDAMVAKLDGRVVSVRVDAIENNVFIGTVVMQKGSELVEFDARASDAIALALGAHAPIYVARSVITRSGVSTSDLGVGAAPAAP